MWYLSKMSDFMVAQHHFCPRALRSVVLNSLMTQRRLKAYVLGHFQKHIKGKKKKKKAAILWQRLKVPAVRNGDKSSVTQLLPTGKLRDRIQTHIQSPWSKPTDQHPNSGPAQTPLATFSPLCRYIKDCYISQRLKTKLLSAGVWKQNLPPNED